MIKQCKQALTEKINNEPGHERANFVPVLTSTSRRTLIMNNCVSDNYKLFDQNFPENNHKPIKKLKIKKKFFYYSSSHTLRDGTFFFHL